MTTNTTAKAGNNSGSKFIEAMSDVFNLNTKVEGVSVKLLSAMYDMETTFDAGFCERYIKTSGSDRTAMLDKLLTDLVPSFGDLKEATQIKLGDYNNPTDRVRMADKKTDAQKKMKTAQNTLRNVCLALLFLRVGPADTDKDGKLVFKKPVTKIDVKAGKVRFATSDGWFQSSYSSITDLTKFGENVSKDIGWNVPKPGTPRPGAAASAGTSVQNTVNKTKATGGMFDGALRELCIGLMQVLGRSDYDKLAESDLTALRDLEGCLIRKVYADKDGYYDIDALVTTYGDKNAKRKRNADQAKHAKATHEARNGTKAA